MKDKIRRKYFSNKDIEIMYLPDSLKFFKINDETKKIVEAINDNVPKDEILERFNVNEDDYSKLVDLLQAKQVVNNTPSNMLEKLTLIISGSCNLKCKYCYANQGKYLKCDGDMSVQTLRNAIDIFFDRYDVIQNIMFFGGEPTLNMPAIKFACSYIKEKVEQGVIKNFPNLGMVTNGTNVTDELIDIINEYKMKITVSIDGPKDVNDYQRVYLDGKGTFDDIEKNIFKLKEKCGQPFAIEATYSKVHQQLGYSVVDIVKMLKDEFGVEKVHVAPVSDIRCSDYCIESKEPFLEAIDDVFKYKKSGKDYSFTSFNLVLEGLKYKRVKTRYCEAGLAKFAVSTEGKIYPCYLFNDEDEMCMGNVNDKDVFSSKKFLEIEQVLAEFNKFEVSKCTDCYYNTMCRQCAAENYFSKKNVHNVPQETCRFSKKRVEKIMDYLARE